MARLDFIMNANMSIDGQIQFLEKYKVERMSNLDKWKYRKDVMEDFVNLSKEEIATREDEIGEANKEIENLKQRKAKLQEFRVEL